MLTGSLKKTIERNTSHLDAGLRSEFFDRMDPDYFDKHTAEEIERHLELLCSISPTHPIRLHVQHREEGLTLLTFAGYDYFSEFAVMCGLLTAFGLDIEAGEVYTYSEGARAAKRIIDLFWVRPLPHQAFDDEAAKAFLKRLTGLVRLLEQGKHHQARQEINREWIKRLQEKHGAVPALLFPVEIKFDRHSVPDWTVMNIRSVDTPGFLYTLANTLAMRNLYIKKVEIRSEGKQVRDRFLLRDRQGRPLKPEEEDTLKMAVVFIKQFTHHLVHAPDPAQAIDHFDLLLDRVFQGKTRKQALKLLSGEKSLDLLARLLGASHFLWEDFLRLQTENLLPFIRGMRSGGRLPGRERYRQALRRTLKRTTSLEDRKTAFNHYKDREIFRVDLQHLADPKEDLPSFSRHLSNLAEAVLEEAYRFCRKELVARHGQPRGAARNVVPMTLLGLGKFGGREMGYASDIELLLIFGETGRTDGKNPVDNRVFFEALARELLHFITAKRDGIFQIDLRLRPFGSKGPLASPYATYAEYFSPTGSAAPFERQALIKLRWAAGDRPLGRRVEGHRDRFVYSPNPLDLTASLHLRNRQIDAFVPTGRINAKYSPGGIIDIEYAVQYLQIQHGETHPNIRTPSTLEAIDGLAAAGLIAPEEQGRLRGSYLFLRRLIDALRIVRGNAKDLLLSEVESEEFAFLARRLGFTDVPWGTGVERLRQEIEKQMGLAHHFFTQRFGRSGDSIAGASSRGGRSAPASQR